jgi:hypothetical protein
MSSIFPPTIRQLLDEHHAGGVTEADCSDCSSPCCTQGGFAILENLPLIYERYRQGALRRPDFALTRGLSLRDFLLTAFDITERVTGRGRRQQEIVLLHMKSLSGDNQLITVPAVGEYYEVRSQLFADNPWLNRGCLFLSHKCPVGGEDDDDSSRRCLLHEPQSATHLTAKPIDCVYFTCSEPLEARLPSEQDSERWFRALAAAYPGSQRRLADLLV